MIIGLTGRNCAGKGVVMQFLANIGFICYSLSDVIRDELKSTNDKITRELLIEKGRELRLKYGPAILAERIASKLDIEKNYAIDSIRHPAEVEVFKRRKDFVLIEVIASPEKRFERIIKRNRENDPKTFEEFIKFELEEEKNENYEGQQLLLCSNLADIKIENNSTIEDLYQRLKQTIYELLKKQPRPSWDEYFMMIAKVVALRSNCLKRKVAAIVVKDKRIISTGYNGTPRGTLNCNEGGCPRCANLVESGSNLEQCLCSHAEENAITQAAYHGILLRDATLYTTYSPCLICSKMIINAGIKEVVYEASYPLADTALSLLEEAGVLVRKYYH
jgi:dCMP deaminase